MKKEPEKQEKTTTLSQVIELTCEYLGHEDMDFQHYVSWFFCVFSDLRQDAFVQFVDIGRFSDHHCLKFHFIKVI